MSPKTNQMYMAITKYVNAGCDLAEQIERDIKEGREVSDRTIIALSLFKDAIEAVEGTLDDIIATGSMSN